MTENSPSRIRDNLGRRIAGAALTASLLAGGGAAVAQADSLQPDAPPAGESDLLNTGEPFHPRYESIPQTEVDHLKGVAGYVLGRSAEILKDKNENTLGVLTALSPALTDPANRYTIGGKEYVVLPELPTITDSKNRVVGTIDTFLTSKHGVGIGIAQPTTNFFPLDSDTGVGEAAIDDTLLAFDNHSRPEDYVKAYNAIDLVKTRDLDLLKQGQAIYSVSIGPSEATLGKDGKLIEPENPLTGDLPEMTFLGLKKVTNEDGSSSQIIVAIRKAGRVSGDKQLGAPAYATIPRRNGQGQLVAEEKLIGVTTHVESLTPTNEVGELSPDAQKYIEEFNIDPSEGSEILEFTSELAPHDSVSRDSPDRISLISKADFMNTQEWKDSFSPEDYKRKAHEAFFSTAPGRMIVLYGGLAVTFNFSGNSSDSLRDGDYGAAAGGGGFEDDFPVPEGVVASDGFFYKYDPIHRKLVTITFDPMTMDGASEQYYDNINDADIIETGPFSPGTLAAQGNFVVEEGDFQFTDDGAEGIKFGGTTFIEGEPKRYRFVIDETDKTGATLKIVPRETPLPKNSNLSPTPPPSDDIGDGSQFGWASRQPH